MVFPNSYLPTTSQPWGREVQKRIELAETAITRNETNNDARDTQLAASLDRLSATVIKTNESLAKVTSVENNVYYPGTTEIDGGNIKTGTITAESITAGTLTGFTVNTALSGKRVELSNTSNSITFYNSSVGGSSGSISGYYTTEDGSALFIDGPSASSCSIVINDTSLDVFGPSASSLTMSALGEVDVNGKINAYNGIQSFSTIASTGSISSNQGLIRTAYIGGGTTGASFNNDGNLIRTTSSERYKQDIDNLDFQYEDVLALQPKIFKLKDEAEQNPEARRYAGFIAEDIAGTPLDIFVAYETLPDGTKRPDGVYYPELTTALLTAIKHQDGLISALTARIEALESKVE